MDDEPTRDIETIKRDGDLVREHAKHVFRDENDEPLRDRKGRVLGCECLLESVPDGWKVRVQPTRDGEHFGAIQKASRFESLDEADKAIANKLIRAEDRQRRRVRQGKA